METATSSRIKSAGRESLARCGRALFISFERGDRVKMRVIRLIARENAIRADFSSNIRHYLLKRGWDAEKEDCAAS